MAKIAMDEPLPYTSSRLGPLASWRGGKSFGRTLSAWQNSSFLPILEQSQEMMDMLTAEFVQNDLINAFFWEPSLSNRSLEALSIHWPQPHNVLPNRIYHGRDRGFYYAKCSTKKADKGIQI